MYTSFFLFPYFHSDKGEVCYLEGGRRSSVEPSLGMSNGFTPVDTVRNIVLYYFGIKDRVVGGGRLKILGGSVGEAGDGKISSPYTLVILVPLVL